MARFGQRVLQTAFGRRCARLDRWAAQRASAVVEMDFEAFRAPEGTVSRFGTVRFANPGLRAELSRAVILRG